MNILFCSAGRRVQLLKDFRQSMSDGSRIVATDMSPLAPAIYSADRFYLVPPITSEDYIPTILNICRMEKIQGVTTLIDPEIELLARHRAQFAEIGVTVLLPDADTAALCFDKWKMYQFLTGAGIRTPKTYDTAEHTIAAIRRGEVSYPLFVKPRTGSGSVGARRVNGQSELEEAFASDPTVIAQQFMQGFDLDADVYVDAISGKTVSFFSKQKLEMKIGGASKTVSFRDPALRTFVEKIVSRLKFHGPIDMDFFCVDGKYYLNEINPRFGGAYLHAYACGVDFVPLIENNLLGIANVPSFFDYEEGVTMMMYDAIVTQKLEPEGEVLAWKKELMTK